VRFIVAIVVLSVVASTRGDDWTHWRGNERSGVSAESSGWDGARWIDKQPTWQAQVGDGASSPLVIDSRVFTFGYADKKNIVNCWNAETGKNVWRVAYPAAAYGRHATGDEGLYSGPSSTPEFDPTTDSLYTLSADGDVHCWNTAKRAYAVRLLSASVLLCLPAS
jgi:WD40 repeat protein